MLAAELGAVPPAFAPLLQFRRVLLAQRRGRARRGARATPKNDGAAVARNRGDPARTSDAWAGSISAASWRRAGEPDRAFAAWTEGHRLLGRLQPFSRADYARVRRGHDQAFDAARLRDGPRAANTDPAPVFIVGMPRSGTTLTEQILDSHPDVHGAGERHALTPSFLQRTRRRLGNGPAAVRRIAGLGASEQAFDQRRRNAYLAGTARAWRRTRRG